MSNLNEIIIRIKADTSNFDNPIDVNRQDLPQFWRGNDINFEIGIFNDENILSVSNYASVSIAIRKMTDDGKVPSASQSALMQKVCTSLDDTVTSTTWADGTKQHAAILFSSAESNIITGDHWLSIWATTKDATPKLVTLCAGIVRVLEDGGGNSSVPPDPIEIYYTADECDDKFVELSAIDTSVFLGTSDDKIPSQNAVKAYVDNKTGLGEANTASNLGEGNGLFKSKIGVDLQFKSVKAGENVTISSDVSEVTISASSGMENPMTAAGDIIVGGDAGSPVRLAKGSSGQVLKMNSGGTGIEWGIGGGSGMENPMTAAGDIIVGGDAGSPARVGVGSAGQVLKTNSNADGLEWCDETSYTLPVATSLALGGVKVGGRLSIEEGVLSADDQSYSLPVASADTLGGVKVGENLTITNGVLAADAQQYTLPTASASTLGGVKVGGRLSIEEGVLSADDQSYSLPVASADTLGGVKVGENLTITNGVLAADTQQYTLPIATTSSLGGIKPDGTTITVDQTTGAASVIGGGSGMQNPMTAAGDIIVGGDAGSPVRLAKGGSGQVLKMNSGGTGIEWGTGGGVDIDSFMSNCLLECPNGVLSFSGAVLIVESGIIALIPNGKNTNGTLKSTKHTVSTDVTYINVSTSVGNYAVFLKGDGTVVSIPLGNYFPQQIEPDAVDGVVTIWYDTVNNTIKSTSDGGTTWVQIAVVYLGYYNLASASATISAVTSVVTASINNSIVLRYW